MEDHGLNRIREVREAYGQLHGGGTEYFRKNVLDGFILAGNKRQFAAGAGETG